MQNGLPALIWTLMLAISTQDRVSFLQRFADHRVHYMCNGTNIRGADSGPRSPGLGRRRHILFDYNNVRLRGVQKAHAAFYFRLR